MKFLDMNEYAVVTLVRFPAEEVTATAAREYTREARRGHLRVVQRALWNEYRTLLRQLGDIEKRMLSHAAPVEPVVAFLDEYEPLRSQF